MSAEKPMGTDGTATTKDMPAVEPRPADQPAKPLRTWRPMAIWTGAILLALGLAWFVATVVVPLFHVRVVVTDFAEGDSHFTFASQNDKIRDVVGETSIQRLGGSAQALRKLRRYVLMPAWFAKHKAEAVYLMGQCGEEAVLALIGELNRPDKEIQKAAAIALSHIGPLAKQAVPALEKLGANGDAEMRSAAAEALEEIRRKEPPK